MLDVRRGLPFESVASIYAEHFLEHLALEEGLAFLRECRRVLSDTGALRVSTPNLDWVYATHYHPGQWPTGAEELHDCMQLNRAFRGWGHQFLYNQQTLTAALRNGGFAKATFCSYGKSELPEFAGLERHETWQDTPDLPHVLVVEGSGRTEPVEFPTVELADYRRDVTAR